MTERETYTVISAESMETAETVPFITLGPDLSGNAVPFTAFALPCWADNGILLHMHARVPGGPRKDDRLECRIIPDRDGEYFCFRVSPSGNLEILDGKGERCKAADDFTDKFRLFMETSEDGNWGAYWVMPAALLKLAVPDLRIVREAVIGARFTAVSCSADGSETVLTWPEASDAAADSTFGLLIMGE